MSVKPTIIPLFDTNLTQVAAPTSAKISDGYVNAAPLPHTDLNWLFNLLGTWVQYLNDGALVGNTSVAGTFGATLAATFGDNVTTAGDLNIGGLTVTTTTKALTGSPNEDTDLSAGAGSLKSICLINLTTTVGTRLSGVTGGTAGRVIILYNNGTSYLDIRNVSSGSLAANRFSFANGQSSRIPPLGFRAFVYLGAWVPLFSGSKHKTIIVDPGIDAIDRTNVHSIGMGQVLYSTSVNPVYYRLPYNPGEVVTGYFFGIVKGTSSATTITAQIVLISAGGAETPFAGTLSTSSGNATGSGAFSLTFATPLIVDNSGGFYMKFSPGGSVSPAADRSYQCLFFGYEQP